MCLSIVLLKRVNFVYDHADCRCSRVVNETYDAETETRSRRQSYSRIRN